MKNKKVCENCGKKIPFKLNSIKDPRYYFKQVQKEEEDCLYWCNWKCIEEFIKSKKSTVFYLS